jgi:hypothetical protein
MKIARDKYGKSVLAEDASLFLHSPFKCIGCKKRLSLHHETIPSEKFFSHLPGSHCSYSDELKEITNAKISLFKYLRYLFHDIKLESYLFGFKSEISFTYKEQIVSINFFSLQTDTDYLKNKLNAFTKNNIFSLFLLPEHLFNQRLSNNIFNALEQDLFIQSVYIQKMFLISSHNEIIPVFLEKQRIYLNKKLNKQIIVCKPFYFEPVLLSSFYFKEELAYKDIVPLRKLFTTFIPKKGVTK